ncbi:MAG: elongation factor G, partial [Firmicutes bacterium]|nr:elongation factor G [Bacillota bacterium]
TFTVEKSRETGQILISGLGDLHLEIMCSRLHKKFGAEVELSTPLVPYRETIRSKAKIEGKHKKQSGGRGQYGHVWIEIEPGTDNPEDQLEFVDNIFGGAVPRQYIPAVEKGIRETMEEGIIAGYPIVALKVILYDGSYHSVDSSEMAFKIAASMALKKGFLEANPVLLEPILNVNVTVPENFMGDVMGDLNKKRGKILGMEPKGSNQVIRAQAPMSEMFRYAIDLRSITQGRGSFTSEFSHYEEVPQQIADAVIAASKEDS